MKFNPAKILVQDYLELNSLTLGLSEWTEEHFKDNPPRLLRLQRIRACLSGLEIEVADFHSFEKGDWVKPVSEELLETILLVLKTPFENPKELRLELKTMVADFGFIDVDLDEIDSGLMDMYNISINSSWGTKRAYNTIH